MEIDVSRGNENSGCGLNKEIVRCIYAGGGGAKPSYGNDWYDNQNKVKTKDGVAVGW